MKQVNRLFTAIIMLGMVLSLFSMPASTAQAQEGEPPVVEPDGEAEVAPLYNAEEGKAVPGQYIVVFKDEIGEPATVAATATEISAQGAEVQFVYTSAIKGFAGRLTSEMVTSLRNDPRVEFIEEDQIVSVNDDGGPSAQSVQAGPVWGLDRIDQVAGTNGYFYYPASAGEGVHVYVIDSGIRTSHSEFGGRATLDYDPIQDGKNGLPTCEPHGTHVAATIGGQTYGVAKKVTLHGVRVLGCDGYGYNSWLIAGIDWVKKNHIKPAVANMSLGGGVSVAEDSAVNAAIASGVTFVVAAGNSDDNACSYSPARTPAAITVGATDSTDARASFSNYGTCVDIFAPGVGITSAINDSDTATDSWDGTSMASPHVAGAVALYLAGNPTATPAKVTWFVIAQSTKNKVLDPVGSPNRLLYISNEVITKPTLLTPTVNAVLGDNTPTLTWSDLYYVNKYQVQYASDPLFSTGVVDDAPTPDPTYTFGSALTDGKWYWRVRGVNAFDIWGPWSATQYFTVDATGPNAPVLKSPANGTSFAGTPTFIWNVSATATRYQFAYGPDNNVANVTYTSPELIKSTHKPATLMELGTSYWFARAKDAAGNWGAWSTPFTITIAAPVPASTVLKSPANNFFTNDVQQQLTWNAVDYAVDYNVQIDTTATFVAPLIQEEIDVAGMSLIPNSLTDGKYYWRVRAQNVNGNYGAWSAPRYFTVDTIAPAAPVLRLPLAGATVTGMPAFSWRASTGATRYVMAIDTYTSSPSTALSHKPPIAIEGSFAWRVYAMDAAGNASPWSAFQDVTIKPGTPSMPTLVSPANGLKTVDYAIDLAWNAAAYGVSYNIQVSLYPSFVINGYTYNYYVSETSYTYTAPGIGSEKKYYWRVRAKNSAGIYGPWSASRSFTTLPSFNSQFNSAESLIGWYKHSGEWDMSGGYFSTFGLQNGFTSSISNLHSFTDFTYEARMKMGYNDSDYYSSSYYGLIVRGTPNYNYWNDWTNAYYFTINQYVDDSGYREGCYDIWRIVNGRWTRLTPYGSSWCTGIIKINDWNTLKVTATGSSLKFYINDNLMWSGTSSSPMGDRLGMFTWYNGWDSKGSYTGRNTPTYVDWAVAGPPVVSSLDEQVLPGQWTSSRFSTPKATK